MCYVPSRTTLYMIPTKYTCPKNWTIEYYGYLMAEQNHAHHYRFQFTCVDELLKPIIGTSHSYDGLLFHLWKDNVDLFHALLMKRPKNSLVLCALSE